MTNIQVFNIQGVDCYEKDGTAFLKLETVARGLGFTQIAASGNEVVRWERVRHYLEELNVPTSGDGKLPEYIPENIFYRLAMKAKNSVAEAFQAKVADEIIPSIRKHGMYATPATIDNILNDPDFGIRLLTELKEERSKRVELEAKVEANAPKVLFSDSVAASNSCILIGQLAKQLRQNGVEIGQQRLFERMRKDGYLCGPGNRKNLPTQRAMEMGLFQIKERTHTNPDGSVIVSRTTLVTGKGQIYFTNKYLINRI